MQRIDLHSVELYWFLYVCSSVACKSARPETNPKPYWKLSSGDCVHSPVYLYPRVGKFNMGLKSLMFLSVLSISWLPGDFIWCNAQSDLSVAMATMEGLMNKLICLRDN
jgi:hypothetical protein